MKEKIEWYQEVLELEPSSKVFFPLARLLAENGRYAEAVSVLRQGLDRHPEHFEARMLFLEMLVRTKQEEEAGELALGIARTMSGYPAFWRKWAQALAGGEDGMDSSVAVSFLAARFDGAKLSWGEIIRRGLAETLGEQASGKRPAVAVAAPSGPAEDAPGEEASEAEDDSELPEFIFDTDGEETPEVFGTEEDVIPAPEEETKEALERPFPASVFAEGDMEADSGEDEDTEGEESFSLRTMTMAGLLADQGDCRGALDIYRELRAREPAGPRRERLDGLIAEMESREAEAASPEQMKAAGGKRQAAEGYAPDAVKGLKGKKKLMSTLEALADRLEDRAAGQG